jgi:hypothetical protein
MILVPNGRLTTFAASFCTLLLYGPSAPRETRPYKPITDILGNRMIEAKSWSLHYGLDNKNNFDMFIYLFLYQSPPFTTGRRWNGVKHTYDQASFDPDDHSSSSRILRSLPLPHVVPVVERVLAS